MSQIPEVMWRWGERYLITDFIQKNNVAVREIADSLQVWPYSLSNQDKFVLAASVHIRDGYYYPLDAGGNPSCSGQVLRYRKALMSYHFKRCEDYVWALPCEVINTKCGYCAETANLATSILIAGNIPNSWVVLGEVRTAKDDRLLGYHAWTECPLSGSQNVMETTVDQEGVNILAPISSTYDRQSQWAQSANLYYRPQSRYNADEYLGEGPLGGMMVQLIGLPAKRVLLRFGELPDRAAIASTLKVKSKRLRREYSQEARIIKQLLLEAYGGL